MKGVSSVLLNCVLFHRSALFAPQAGRTAKAGALQGRPRGKAGPATRPGVPGLPRSARARQPSGPAGTQAVPAGTDGLRRQVHRKLPGSVVRKEGEPPPATPPPTRPMTGWGTPTASTPRLSDAIRSTAKACTLMPRSTTAAVRQRVLGRPADGLRGRRRQGLRRFTKSLNVIAHELTHGVTQYAAALDYRGQPGALNESSPTCSGRSSSSTRADRRRPAG